MKTATSGRVSLVTKPEETGVLELLHSGPRSAKELQSALSDARRGMTEQGFYKHVRKLAAQGKILQLPYREGSEEGRFASLFALPQHWSIAVKKSGFLPVAGCDFQNERVKNAILDLRLKLCREPTEREVAKELGEALDLFTGFLIYRVGLEVGWRRPGSKEIREAEQEHQRVVSTAQLLKRGTAAQKVMRTKPGPLLQRAKEYLERFPDLVP